MLLLYVMIIYLKRYMLFLRPIFYLDTLIMRSESIEVTLRTKRVFFAGFVARMEDTRLLKCLMFGEMMGEAVCMRGQEKEWMGYFLDDLRAFGINADQWITAAQDEGEIAQDGGTRGGTFHGVMNCCRENHDWNTACNSMYERDGKHQGEDSPKQVGSFWFACKC